MSKSIIIGNDHGAVDLKKSIINHLEKKGYKLFDLGTEDGSPIDYPDMAQKLCSQFLSGDYLYGILLCGTGIGISMAANKINGIRCALPQNLFAAEMCKSHNNANILSFGGRIAYGDSVLHMIDKYMETKYEGGRHIARVEKIMALEK